MNKKIIILICLFLIICLILLVEFLTRKNTMQEESILNNLQTNEDTISIEDSSGKKYTAIYNADSFVYEIFDDKGQLLFVSPNSDGLSMYIENPDLINAVNEYN